MTSTLLGQQFQSLGRKQAHRPDKPTHCRCSSSSIASSRRTPHTAPLHTAPAASLSRQSTKCKAVAEKKTFSSFDSMLSESDTPILVDFYATWCGPCQMMSGILSEVSRSMTDDLQVVKIDTDKYPALATKYRIQGLPTLLLFRNGKVIDRIEGMLDQKALGNRLRYYLRGLNLKFGRAQ